MKNRIRKIAYFFAFNLLFFALYLNFIHNDQKNTAVVEKTKKTRNAAFGGTILVADQAKYGLHK